MKEIITLLDVRNEAVGQIARAFNNPKIKIAAHPGRFSEQEIRRLAIQTPAVLTSIVKAHDGESSDSSYIEMVSWVLYRATNADKLYDGGLSLVSVLMPVIRSLDAEWAYNTENIEAENLFSGTLGEMNITLWAVSWRWNIRGSVLCGQGAGLSGGIHLPDGLDNFEGTDSSLVVGNQTVSDITNLEV